MDATEHVQLDPQAEEHDYVVEDDAPSSHTDEEFDPRDAVKPRRKGAPKSAPKKVMLRLRQWNTDSAPGRGFVSGWATLARTPLLPLTTPDGRRGVTPLQALHAIDRFMPPGKARDNRREALIELMQQQTGLSLPVVFPPVNAVCAGSG